MIPPRLQGALWRGLGEQGAMAAQMEERLCFTNPGAADPRAPAGLSGAASWDSRNEQNNPKVVDEIYQELWSCGWNLGMSQQVYMR
ncbi:hypothetical protein DUI87_13079 [Hirundo rustica rustica]|uniref:Uncharacterized protein n=1 Tax=Hirundo rustica rustica TaxID=333673 RepID=A0A3M0KT11_HIRRU|nr:hypothetical protein DUI87_13079 [Hirundo rustica rustica]